MATNDVLSESEKNAAGVVYDDLEYLKKSDVMIVVTAFDNGWLTNNIEKLPSLKPVEIDTFKASSHKTLRDEFAVKAMQAIITNSKNELLFEKDVAEYAYKYADAMMKVRRK